MVCLYLAMPLKMTVAQDVSPESLPTSPHSLVVYYAKKYKVSQSKMNTIIKCESSWNTNAINHTSKEYSAGLVQINLLAHKNITIEQAQNPQFAIRFLAYHLSQGHASMWTCAKGVV